MSGNFKARIWLLITLFFTSNRMKKVRKLLLKVQEEKTSFEVFGHFCCPPSTAVMRACNYNQVMLEVFPGLRVVPCHHITADQQTADCRQTAVDFTKRERACEEA